MNTVSDIVFDTSEQVTVLLMRLLTVRYSHLSPTGLTSKRGVLQKATTTRGPNQRNGWASSRQ